MAWDHIFATLQLVLAMVGMGLGLTPRDFVAVATTPRPLVTGLAAQWLLAPALAAALAAALGLSPGVTLGLMLIAAMPAGSLANLFTVGVDGRIALSICLVAVETCAAVVVTPLVLRVGAGSVLSAHLTMPIGTIVSDVGVDLLAPLTAGMLARRWWPAAAPRLARLCLRGAGVSLVLFIASTLALRHSQLATPGLSAAVAVVGLAVALTLAGSLAARGARLERSDRCAVVLQLVMRNSNLALLLASTMLDGVADAEAMETEVLYVAFVFGAVSIGVGAAYVALGRLELARIARVRGKAAADAPEHDAA
jgi:BASS family bile acid:Na+ symporter